MEYTKEFRNTVYKAMLDKLHDGIARKLYYQYKCDGLCIYLTIAVIKLARNETSGKFVTIKNFPELIKHKPFISCIGNNQYWFKRNEKGAAKRIKILEQAIRETE